MLHLTQEEESPNVLSENLFDSIYPMCNTILCLNHQTRSSGSEWCSQGWAPSILEIF